MATMGDKDNTVFTKLYFFSSSYADNDVHHNKTKMIIAEWNFSVQTLIGHNFPQTTLFNN